MIDEKYVGVGVIRIKQSTHLRISLRPHHLKGIGVPQRVDVRGSFRDGVLVARARRSSPTETRRYYMFS